MFGTLAWNLLKDLKQQLRWILRALNQVILSSATPNTRRAHVELETDEGEGEGESSRGWLGSNRTKFDAPPLVWSPQGPRLVATGPSGCVVFPG